MPEAHVTKPPKCVQTETGSETDASGSNTARSSDDPNQATAAANTNNNNKTKQQRSPNQKPRKSKGRRNSQKKPLKIPSQQKTVGVLNLKSQIPRPFQQQLSPSSSTTSISTLSTTTKSTQLTTPRPPGLLRQSSSIRLDFRLRKSISQMDFKQSRRTGYTLPSPAIGRGAARAQDSQENHNKNNANKICNMCDIVANGKHENPLTTTTLCTTTNNLNSPGTPTTTLTPKSGLRNGGIVVTQSQSALVHKMFQQDDYYYVLQERDPRVAGMRIFATIMLNAWRKRRTEVKQLTSEVNDLKRGSIKAKNQLHVFNTLFRVEQKRNDELSCQLKRSLEDINQTKSSCESLTTSLISLKADKALLEQQLQIKEQEFEGINTILTQTKSELFKAMSQQRELQANLSMEQRKVQTLENQKNELINEICELNNESLQKEEALRKELTDKTEELAKTREEIIQLEAQLETSKQDQIKISDFESLELDYKSDIEKLQAEIDELKKCLSTTLTYRMKSYWKQTIYYQQTTLSVVHWIAYYMLPATPPPKITSLPFGLTLQKALSIVKR